MVAASSTKRRDSSLRKIFCCFFPLKVKSFEKQREELIIEEAPSEETSLEEPPIEETRSEETPIEEPPIEETPFEEPPIEETPIEETPTEEESLPKRHKIIKFNEYVEVTEAENYDRRSKKPWTKLSLLEREVSSMSSATPVDDKEVAELLARATKKHVSKQFSTDLIAKLPQVAHTQSLTNMGKLLDASAKIFAYKVDQTYIEAQNALRDINKQPRKKAEKENVADEGSKAKDSVMQTDYREYEIKESDAFQRISREDEESQELPQMDFLKRKGKVELPNEESYSRKADLFPGAPNSDDNREAVKERHEKIRKKCRKIAKSPNNDVPLSDSSDEETTLQQRDVKLYDHFECVKFRNQIRHDNARKFLLPEEEFDVDLDDNEPYNPLYSKTIRRTGITAGALMLANTAMSENGLIMRLHPRGFTRPQLKPLDLPSLDEVRAHEDFLGIMQKCLNPDKENFKVLIREASKKGIQEAVKRRKSQKFVVDLGVQTQLTTQQKADFTMNGSDENCVEIIDELIDPDMFIEEVETKARRNGRKGKVNRPRKVMRILPTSSCQRSKTYKVRCEAGKLVRQLFAEEELDKTRNGTNWDMLMSLTEEDATNLGISSGLMNRLKDAATQKSISDQLLAEVGSLVRDNQKNALLEILFGDNLNCAPDGCMLSEVKSSGINFNFTDDFYDFDSMWHCQIAQAVDKDEASASQLRNRKSTKIGKSSLVLVRGNVEQPLYFNQDFKAERQGQNSLKVPEHLSMKPLRVTHIPYISELPIRVETFEESGRSATPTTLGKSFGLIERAFGAAQPSLHPNNNWVETLDVSVIKLPKFDIEERAQARHFKRYGEDGASVVDESEFGDHASPPKRFRESSVVSVPPLDPSDHSRGTILDQLERNVDTTAKTRRRTTSRSSIRSNLDVAINESFLGDLQFSGDTDDIVNTPARPMFDNSHWKTAQDDPTKTPATTKGTKGKRRTAVQNKEDEYSEDDEEKFDIPPRQKYFFRSDMCFEGIIKHRTKETDEMEKILLIDRGIPEELYIPVKYCRCNEEPRTPDLPKEYTFNDLFRAYSASANEKLPVLTPKPRKLLKAPRSRSQTRAPSKIPSREMEEQPQVGQFKRYGENSVEDELGGRPQSPREGSVAPFSPAAPFDSDMPCDEPNNDRPETLLDRLERITSAHNQDDAEMNVDQVTGYVESAVDEPVHIVDDSPWMATQKSAWKIQSQATNDDDEMYSVQYKQSRVDAPLVKRAIAAILSNSTESDVQSMNIEEAVGVVQEFLADLKTEISDHPELDKEFKALNVRIADFVVSGHHTFTNLLARLPPLVDQKTAEDLKPSTALTILLHMCNENVLDLFQTRCRKTGLVSEAALDDFTIKSDGC
ncbi:hypothetical protein QR680_012465 [Steinernema hermaphroditum]|uniref:Condensin complex subunit 2 n=1 Tax=Steinernema hermaphroditum TaxID=289476 RepID=A0AA39I248_9BILA|nr:hypothetical protein QR680_012465 [Steinernema hermaphroditum]